MEQPTDNLTYKNIPQALRDRSQWIAWKYVPNLSKPKPDKEPFDSHTKRAAKSNNSTTWGTFDQALSLKEALALDGLGYVFTAGDGLTGVDLDNCRDAHTGEIAPWAQEIIDAHHSYTEISPSGTEVHILVEPKLSIPTKIIEGDIEIFCDRCYFTVSGLHLDGTPLTIEPRQDQVEALYQHVLALREERQRREGKTKAVVESQVGVMPTMPDDALLRHALKARSGRKLARLWRGDTRGYGSASEADMALCGILAFWTQDAAQVNRLFQRSGLYRAKWDERHYTSGQSYGDKIIEKVLATRGEREDAHHV